MTYLLTYFLINSIILVFLILNDSEGVTLLDVIVIALCILLTPAYLLLQQIGYNIYRKIKKSIEK